MNNWKFKQRQAPLAGGDVLSVRYVEKYLSAIGESEQRLINGHGPTENTIFICCHVLDRNTRLNGSVPIGRPITNTQVYVLDAEMPVVPAAVKEKRFTGIQRKPVAWIAPP